MVRIATRIMVRMESGLTGRMNFRIMDRMECGNDRNIFR
jgi:hypothetical protein